MLNTKRLSNPVRATFQATFGGDFSFKVAIALFVVYTVWGSTYLGLKVAMVALPPLLLNGVRFTLAGFLLLLWLRWRGEPMPTRRQWGNSAFVGVLLMAGGAGLTAFAMQWVSSGLAALAGGAIPLWTLLFASFYEARPTRFEIFGLIMGFLGIIVLNVGNELWINPLGMLGIIIAPILWAYGSIRSRHLDLPSGMLKSACMLISGGVFLTIAGVATGEHLLAPITAEVVLAWLYLTVIGSMLAFSAYQFLLHNAQAALATSYAYVNPIIAVFLGWALANEALTLQTILAAVLIVGAVFVLTNRPKPH